VVRYERQKLQFHQCEYGQRDHDDGGAACSMLMSMIVIAMIIAIMVMFIGF
jgi:hypothetical protein